MRKKEKREYRRNYHHTIRFTKEIWDNINKNISKLGMEKSITIDYIDEEYDYIKNMDEAYHVICSRKEEIKKINVYAGDDDEGYISISMTDAEKCGDVTLSLRAMFKDEKVKENVHDFLDSINYDSRVFHDGFNFALSFFSFSLFRIIFDIIGQKFLGMTVGFVTLGSIGYLVLVKYREKINNYIYGKNGIQFWIDETSELKYKIENRKARWKVAAIFALSLLIIWFNVSLV